MQPTLANANMVLLGRPFRRGEQVPQTILDSIEGGRRDALYRQRLLKDVSPEEAAAVASRLASRGPSLTGEDGMCPDCGAGPFQRLAQHQSQMHKNADRESAQGTDEMVSAEVAPSTEPTPE
jgi:hypothetical protein